MSGTTDEADAPGEAGLFPVDNTWIQVLFYSGVIAWLGWLLWEATSWDDFKTRAGPYLVGGLLIVLLAMKILRTVAPDRFERAVAPFRADDDPDDPAALVESLGVTESTRSQAAREKHALIITAWAVALPVLLHLVGFSLVVPIYTFAFGLFYLRDLRTALAMAISVTVFVYVLFIVLLQMTLWPGTLGLPNLFEIVSEGLGL